MTRGNHPAIFSFEDAREDLVWMPFAARRALDAVGAKLALEAWQGLSHADRWALVDAGASDEIDTVAVEGVLTRAAPSPERTPSWHAPASPTDDLVDAAGDAPLLALWPRLAPLERYALIKLAASSRRSAAAVSERVRTALSALQRERSAEPAERQLTHLDDRGRARMVDVAAKSVSHRVAVAVAEVRMRPETLALLRSGGTPKGDALATARIAGIQAAKRTSELIPLCHVVALSSVEVMLAFDEEIPGVRISTTAKALDRTGVEMEALVAASVAGLTLYDMLKAVDREMTLAEVKLVSKSGGRTGDYRRGEP